MPLERQRVAAKVDDLWLHTHIHRNADGSFNYDALYDYERLTASGQHVSTASGDAIPHLTGAERTALQNILQAKLTLANTEGV